MHSIEQMWRHQFLCNNLYFGIRDEATSNKKMLGQGITISVYIVCSSTASRVII